MNNSHELLGFERTVLLHVEIIIGMANAISPDISEINFRMNETYPTNFCLTPLNETHCQICILRYWGPQCQYDRFQGPDALVAYIFIYAYNIVPFIMAVALLIYTIYALYYGLRIKKLPCGHILLFAPIVGIVYCLGRIFQFVDPLAQGVYPVILGGVLIAFNLTLYAIILFNIIVVWLDVIKTIENFSMVSTVNKARTGLIISGVVFTTIMVSMMVLNVIIGQSFYPVAPFIYNIVTLVLMVLCFYVARRVDIAMEGVVKGVSTKLKIVGISTLLQVICVVLFSLNFTVLDVDDITHVVFVTTADLLFCTFQMSTIVLLLSQVTRESVSSSASNTASIVTLKSARRN